QLRVERRSRIDSAAGRSAPADERVADRQSRIELDLGAFVAATELAGAIQPENAVARDGIVARRELGFRPGRGAGAPTLVALGGGEIASVQVVSKSSIENAHVLAAGRERTCARHEHKGAPLVVVAEEPD